MMKVKQWLTEILLGVTSEELTSVAKEVYKKAKQKAAKGIMHNTQLARPPPFPSSTAATHVLFTLLSYICEWIIGIHTLYRFNLVIDTNNYAY